MARVTELDDVASNTMREVTLALLTKALTKDLADQSTALARVRKAITKGAAANNSAASNLRLEKVKSVLGTATSAVAELHGLAALIDTPDQKGKTLVASIKSAIKAVSDVQKRLGPQS